MVLSVWSQRFKNADCTKNISPSTDRISKYKWQLQKQPFIIQRHAMPPKCLPVYVSDCVCWIPRYELLLSHNSRNTSLKHLYLFSQQLCMLKPLTLPSTAARSRGYGLNNNFWIKYLSCPLISPASQTPLNRPHKAYYKIKAQLSMDTYRYMCIL